MAGHSKWNNIQHRKGRQDAKKAKVFTKIIREITVAARSGSDPSHNAALRLSLEKAYNNNMAKDAVERAIKRGSGEQNQESYFAVTYEGYASGGVAILVECLTDNINRTVSDVRHCFTKFNGNLGTSGSVAYLFNPVGLFIVRISDEDTLLEQILDFEIENLNEVASDGENSADEQQKNSKGKVEKNKLFEISCQLSDFEAVKERMNQANFDIVFSERTKVCDNKIECDETGSQNIIKVIEALEDLDDVQNVFHNGDITID